MKPPRKITGRAVLITAIFALFTSGKDSFGQLDPTFHPPFFAVPSAPARAQLLADGGYVLFFNIDTLTDQPTGPIIRFLSDGTLDTSFNLTRDYSFTGTAAPTSDGKLVISASQTVYGFSDGTEAILRLNADGSIDSSFSPVAKAFGNVRAIAFQPDGKILVAGFFTQFAGQNRPGIVRLLANGSLDTSFAPVSIQGGQGFLIGNGAGVWARPAVQSDGKILIGGDFTVVNDINCLGIARLNSNGTLDTTFNASGYTRDNDAPIRGIVIQSNGKIVIGGRLLINGTGGIPLARLNSNGSLDSSFVYASGFFAGGGYPGSGGRVRDLIQQPDGKLLPATKRIVRFNADGSLDSSFHEPLLLVYRDNTVNFPEAFTVNLQSDGHILIGGGFTDINDAPPSPPGPALFGVARLNSDGTVDDTLTTTHDTGSDVSPSSFARQSDGTTLIAFVDRGLTSAFGDPAIPHNYGRLNSDGTLDTSFDPLASLPGGPVTGLGFAVLSNGNIFGWGTDDATGTFEYGVLLPDGMIADPNYNDDPNVSFDKAYPQPLTPGQVLVLNSGSDVNFTDFQRNAQNVVNNTELQRVNSDGSLDTSFVHDPSILANTVQRDISGNLQTVAAGSAILALSSDGKILFAYLATDSTYRLVRLNPNGSLDTTFQEGSVPANTTVSSVLVHDPQTNADVTVTVLSPNGVPGFSDAQLVAGNQFIVVGQFASYASVPAHGIVRLNGDGTVDSTFNVGNGAQWTQTVETATFHPSIDNIEQAGNAKLLITGTFEAFNGVTFPGIALLNPDGSLDTSFVPPATRQKFSDYNTAYLAKQPDNSFLLSGPYSLPNQTQSPSFIHIFGAPVITSPLTAAAIENQLFVYQVIATGTPTSYTATPVPAGLTFHSDTGILGGTPTSPGTTQIQLTASNSFGTGTATLTLTVQPAPGSGPVVMSGTSLTARTGVSFSYEVFTTGGSSTARLSATGLPPGLSVDPVTGIISGTPTADGSFGVILTVTDGGVTNTFTLELTFTSDPAIPVITSPREAALTAGQFFTYTIVAPGDPSEQTTFSLIGNLPLGLTFNAATGTISGTYSPQFQNGGALLGNVQLIATNSSGTATSPLSFFQGVSATAVNISTRLAVGTIDNVLIGGFIVTGNAPKKVIVRAIGPSLTAFGVPTVLQDPTLELHDHTGTLIAKNDDWQTTEIYGVITADQSAAIQASGLAPTDNRESAMIVTLAQNNGDPASLTGHYTAIISGKGGTTGNALVEAYDLGTASLDVSSNAQLANISTRGLVQTGDDVMIGGFIVQGDMPATVIVRAIGPSLTAYGVQGALQDPTLELHDGSGAVIGTNDNWQDDPGAAQIQADHLAPSDPRESATIVPLDPGNYTAIVRGANGTTGVALVEAYVLQ